MVEDCNALLCVYEVSRPNTGNAALRLSITQAQYRTSCDRRYVGWKPEQQVVVIKLAAATIQ